MASHTLDTSNSTISALGVFFAFNNVFMASSMALEAKSNSRVTCSSISNAATAGAMEATYTRGEISVWKKSY